MKNTLIGSRARRYVRGQGAARIMRSRFRVKAERHGLALKGDRVYTFNYLTHGENAGCSAAAGAAKTDVILETRRTA
jgi:hypothetical protein